MGLENESPSSLEKGHAEGKKLDTAKSNLAEAVEDTTYETKIRNANPLKRRVNLAARGMQRRRRRATLKQASRQCGRTTVILFPRASSCQLGVGWEAGAHVVGM